MVLGPRCAFVKRGGGAGGPLALHYTVVVRAVWLGMRCCRKSWGFKTRRLGGRWRSLRAHWFCWLGTYPAVP